MVRYEEVVNDVSKLPYFVDYYEKELYAAKKECKIGGMLERQVQELPGITEHRFNQLQEIEALLNYLNIMHRQTRKAKYMKFLQGYNQTLSSRDAQIYADAEDDVINSDLLINEIALLRNKFLGIMKSIESKNFQLGHISKLRVAGLEDVSI